MKRHRARNNSAVPAPDAACKPAVPDAPEVADALPKALEEQLIAGTPREVAERYARLPELADDVSLTLLESPVVVFDTETTGTNPARCHLIEIAAKSLEGSRVVADFHTFVDPGVSVPPEIVELTGIADADVKGAPSPKEAVAAFADFAGSTPLVAHNASFDKGFVMRQAEPGALSQACIDTLALSNIVLPRLRSHRLADLAAAFGIAEQPTHRADADVDALCQVWRILLAGLSLMPAGLAGAIAGASKDTVWELRSLFEQAAGASPGVGFSLLEARTRRIGASGGKERADADDVPLTFVAADEIDKAFSSEGILGAAFAGYERREEQAAMAQEINSALQEGTHRVLEAGTGVGKSMAYLVPLALTAQKNKIVVGIATKTNALMDQLVYQELPRLARALGGVDYVALKGYEHYPCLRKLEALMRREGQDPSAIEKLATLVSFVEQTAWGDLDALNLYWDSSLPRSAIQAHPDECLKRRCPFYPAHCYLHGARHHAARADIVVTNHALLFRDMQLDGGILPPIRCWVIDEAHAVEPEARKQLSHGFSARELDAALQQLVSSRFGIVPLVRSKAAALEGGAMLYGVTADVDQRAATVAALADSVFAFVKDFADADGHDTSYNRISVWIGPALRETGAWASFERPARSLAQKIDGLVKRLRDLVTMLEEFEGAFSAQTAGLTHIICSLSEMLDTLALVVDGQDNQYVYSAELDRRPDVCAEALRAEFFDVGEALADGFYPRMRSVVFTSATLSTGDENNPFGHFFRASGLDRLKSGLVKARQLASSYDFDAHMSVVLPEGFPEPSNRSYQAALAELLYQVHVAMSGSVLTLFTNRRDMESLYRQLKPELAEAGIGLVAQTRSSSAKSLRDRFLADPGLSLFALKSFWEGFDAPGDTLRCVVIPKLPFSRPTDPLSCERELRCKGSAWRHYSLPEAVVELKQAAGRLIRSSRDEGWLVLADGRLQTKGYGKLFLRAMPTHDVRVVRDEEISRMLREEHPGLHS